MQLAEESNDLQTVSGLKQGLVFPSVSPLQIVQLVVFDSLEVLELTNDNTARDSNAPGESDYLPSIQRKR
jgi:hypothetical protein